MILQLLGRWSSLKKQCAIVLASMALILLLPFLAVFQMGSVTLQLLGGSSSIKAATAEGFYAGGIIPGNTYAWGNCTYWSYALRLWSGNPIPLTWGNANTWDDRARMDGYIVNHTPAVGAIYQTDVGDYGHVAYVSAVQPDGVWTISEMNARGFNVVNARSFSPSAAAYSQFIHGKKGASTWTSSPLSESLLATGR